MYYRPDCAFKLNLNCDATYRNRRGGIGQLISVINVLHVSFDKTSVGMRRQVMVVGTQGRVGFYLPPQVVVVQGGPG